MTCVPYWAAALEAERARDRRISSGCPSLDDNVIPCDPNELRRRAEVKLWSYGLLPKGQRLSLDAYSIARNVASEAGSGSIAEKVGIAEAAINRARKEKKGITAAMLKNGELYARQRGRNPPVATFRDPSWIDFAVAFAVLSGVTDNYVDGATHYFAPRIMKDKKWELLDTWSRNWGTRGPGRSGLAWIGPKPGIDHNAQFFMTPALQDSPYWLAQYAAAKLALAQTGEPAIARVPICAAGGQGGGMGWLLGLGLVASGAFFLWARKRALG